MAVRLLRTAFAVTLLFCAADAFSQSKRPIRKTTLRLSATAYCQHGRTKSGAQTREGIVAADPRRLPLGTRISIIAPGKSYSGIYTVMDTGSRVKGRELDIFMPSCSKARKFGRRVVEARVLNETAGRLEDQR